MELTTVYELYLNGESKKIKVGLMDEDPTMQITRIVENGNSLECYTRLRKTENDEWTEEFLGAKYVNYVYSRFQFPVDFLEEGEIFG